MEGRHAICGSTVARNMSRNLADSLSKMNESCNLTSVWDMLDVSTSKETNVNATEHPLCEELATKLATSSGEVLANTLSRNGSVNVNYFARLCGYFMP